jgi:hypothetical protein
MAGGNWDFYQPLSNGKVEWPTGPTGTLDPGYEPRWVQAWVVQGGTMGAGNFNPGPSQSSSESSWSGWAPPGRWTASEPGWVNGPLQPGPATGIAVIALYNRNTNPPTHEYEWWYDAIWLY